MRTVTRLILGLFLLTPVLASAAVIHVPADQPTIADAIAIVMSGDEIIVAAGTYSITEQIYTEVKGFTLRADGDVTLEGEYGVCGAFAFGADYVTTGTTVIEGFEFMDITGCAAIDIDGEYSLEVRDCLFWLCGAGADIAGCISAIGCELLVEDCVFGSAVFGELAGAIACSFCAAEIVGCEFNFCEASPTYGAGAIHFDTSIDAYVVRDCVFFQTWGSAVIISEYGGSTLIEGCTFFDNDIEDDGALLRAGQSSTMIVDRCLLAFSYGGADFACTDGGTLEISCTDSFGNAGGDWVDCAAAYAGVNGNISLDPLFCDPWDGDYTLNMASPCLPDNNDCGVIMGAFGMGCGETAVEDSDWGRLKSLY